MYYTVSLIYIVNSGTGRRSGREICVCVWECVSMCVCFPVQTSGLVCQYNYCKTYVFVCFHFILVVGYLIPCNCVWFECVASSCRGITATNVSFKLNTLTKITAL